MATKPQYLETVSQPVLRAAQRLYRRECGFLLSDLWPPRKDDAEDHNELAESRDCALVAAAWQQLHPASVLSPLAAAVAWVRDFSSELFQLTIEPG